MTSQRVTTPTALTSMSYSHLALLSLVCLTVLGAWAESQVPISVSPVHATSSSQTSDVKVPVVLGVMSRCPDAVLCESVFDYVLKDVLDKVNLSLTFIGRLNSSEPDFGVTCMHGPDECAGNVQELCAMKYTPTEQWWNYVQCQNFEGRDKVGLPNIATKCASTAGFDWEESGVGECAGLDGSGKGEEGVQLLKESVKNTQRLGIEKSCTILINGKEVCIHDGTWKSCEGGHTPSDFVRQINEEYDKLNGDASSGSTRLASWLRSYRSTHFV